MYQKSEFICPKCFRFLRILRLEDSLYCPDTIKCRWKINQLRLPKVSKEFLQEQLSEAIGDKDFQRVIRIKELIIQL